MGFGFVGFNWRYDGSVFPVNIHPGHESHHWGCEITTHMLSRMKEALNTAVWLYDDVCLALQFNAFASATAGDKIRCDTIFFIFFQSTYETR